MAQEFFDAGEEAKKKVNKRYDPYCEKARELSDGGKLKLVSEQICEPFQGYSFELDKGQVIRYEVLEGPQIIDTIYHVRSRPTEEWACSYHSTVLGAMTPYEGMHYYSNTPWTRPLLSIIKDTVDHEKIREAYGPNASHNFIYNSGRCTSGLYEIAYGVVNSNSCDMNLKQAMLKRLGEEKAKLINTPAAFMHFQPVTYDKIPMNLTYCPTKGLIDKGDYVELLAHEDLYLFISPCPLGDQNDTSSMEGCINWPWRVAIYEGADGPLETAPDPHHKTTEPFEFIKAGRPNMVTGKVGKKS